MKALLLICLLSIGFIAGAQVAVNTDGSSPDASAMLDVKSTTKGLLAPRMTQAQRNLIVSPATGLVIFQTDAGAGLYYNSGTPGAPIWGLVGNTAGQWLNNGSSIYYNLGNVGIGRSAPLERLDIDGYLRVANTTDYSFIHLNLATGFPGGNTGLTFNYNDIRQAHIYYAQSEDLLRMNCEEYGGYRNDLVITNEGNVGIGTSTPTNLFQVAKNTPGFTAAFGDPVNAFTGGTNVAIGDYTSTSLLYVGQDNMHKGYLIWNYNADPLLSTYRIGTYNGSNPVVLQPDYGNVGIRELSPAALLHVSENNPGYTAAFGTPVSTWSSSTNVSIGDNNGPAMLYIGQDGNYKGFLGWDYNITPADAYFTLGSYAGITPLVLQNAGGNVGIGTTTPLERLQVEGRLNIYPTNNYPFMFLNIPSTMTYGNAGISFTSELAMKAWIYYDGSINALRLNAENGPGFRNDLVINSTGNIGIGLDAPVGKLHIIDNDPGYTAIFGSPISTWTAGTNVSVGDDNTSSYVYVGQNESNKGFFSWQYNATPANAFLALGSYAGNNPLILQHAGGKVGIGTTTPVSKLEVRYDVNSSAYLGYSNIYGSHFLHYEVDADGDGQSAMYALRSRSVSSPGSGYNVFGSNQAYMGYSYWGDQYTFGTSGFNYNDFTRCGGVLGAYQGGSYWGSLGYKNSGSTPYGGYFTSYTSGAGKSIQAETGIGIGAWGDLMGADIHGKVYGLYAEGTDYAMFSNGNVYKNKLDVHLQDNGTGKNQVLYTSVSTDVTIQTSGVASLSNGKASIVFDPAFTNSVSAESPVIVTVTPIGNSNGVYLAEVSTSGFSLVENNAGKSSVEVNYIAIGKRAGYEHPVLSKEVTDAGYTAKLAAGLHNDADTQTNGEGLYYENGQLTLGVHPSLLPDPNKPSEESIRPKPGEPQKGVFNPNSGSGAGSSDPIPQRIETPVKSVYEASTPPNRNEQINQQKSTQANPWSSSETAGGTGEPAKKQAPPTYIYPEVAGPSGGPLNAPAVVPVKPESQMPVKRDPSHKESK